MNLYYYTFAKSLNFFQMKQTVISFMYLFIAVIICLSGCKKVTEEESLETIAANLLKQGKADPELLIGTWKLIKFAYTPDGHSILNISSIVYGNSTEHPTLEIPEDFSNEWKFCYHNYFRTNCKINGTLINFLNFRSITMVYAPVEREVVAAFMNAYSYVIVGDELIIYFKNNEYKNLLVLKKQIEETPEVIAENMLKQGTADLNLLPGDWLPISYGYTYDGNNLFHSESILFGLLPLPDEELPKFVVPDNIENDWCLYFYNYYKGNCSLKSNIISFSYFDSMTAMKPKPEEIGVVDAIRNAYSFVIKDNELIIYYKKGNKKNLLFFTKDY